MDDTNQNDFQNQSDQNKNEDIFNQNKLLSFDQIESSENTYLSKKEEINLEINKKIRIEIIHKTYTLLFAQFIIIILFTIITKSFKSLQYFMEDNLYILYFFIFMILFLPIIIIYFQENLKGLLKNYIMFLVFAFAVAYCIGFICFYLNQKIVFLAVLIAFVIEIILSLFAINTTININIEGIINYILICIIYLCCILFIFIRNNLMQIIISLLCIILCSFCVIYDTQNIVEDKYYAIIFDYYIIFIHLYNIFNKIF